MNMTTREIARFGLCYLQNGVWGGKNVIHPQWVQLATARHTFSGWRNVGVKALGEGGDWEQGYGFQFWRTRHNSFRADGAFGQYALAMPDQNMSIAVTSGGKNMQQILDMLWDDLLPELSAHIKSSGGERSAVWKYLSVLDKYEIMMASKGYEVSNALRAAVLMTVLLKADGKEGASRRVMQAMQDALKTPKATYFTAVLLMESRVRLSKPPAKTRMRFIYNRDFLDALDYNRIIARAEKRSEKIIDKWADFYEEKGNK